ncbi:MAG: UPF0175 family protein [bacterium]|nr:UPF0175 family protein [bacterium]
MPTKALFELPMIMKKEMDALVRSGFYANKDEVSKDAFRVLLAVRPNLKIEAAVQLYKDKEVSLGKAAEIGGVSTVKFKDILADRGIIREIGSRNKKEFIEGLSLITELRK